MTIDYDVYENGYWNGIQFGYIPDLNKEQLRLWGIGYKDAKNKCHKTIAEIDAAISALDKLTKEEGRG